jgi:signal transduction histidine kinase
MLHKPLPAEVAEARARQARRMEIVGELTGGVVHDFNNILTVISGTIDILAEAVADRPDLAAITKLIGEAAVRGTGLTSNLLDLTRGQPSQPRDVDVVSLLAVAARLLRPTLGELIEISAKSVAGVPPALADPGQLMFAILDLAILARDELPGGGKLSLEAGHAGREISAEDFVMIAVNATGHSAIADHPELVFTDIGMVEDFVGQSGGHLEVSRKAGRGTSVRLYLPRAAVAQSSNSRE